MASDATTPQEYLDGLAEDRRARLEPVYRLVRDSVPAGYEETVAYGMITWQVPLATFPDTYNGQPLAYVSLAAQKKHNALYLMGLYLDSGADADFRRRWAEDGRKLDMGKSCLRFQDPADLRTDLLAEAVAATPPERLIELHQQARSGNG